MKLQPYQLCRWCDHTLCGLRGPLALRVAVFAIGHALLLALCALTDLFQVVLPFWLTFDAVAVLYLLHRHHAFGASYQRKPRPKDALCETVLIDASLIGQGTRLRAAAQPIDTGDGLTMRLGSGVLLLGAAMVHTADTLSRNDRAAILSAVQEVNIQPARMRSHQPVLRREEEDTLTIVTVRDGVDERRYYLGDAWTLVRKCGRIWEGNARDLTDHDRLRVMDTAAYMGQGICRVLAYATALPGEEPTFLGLCGVGEEINLQAMQDIGALRGMGLTVMLDPGTQPDTDLDALRSLLDLPDHHARADLHMAPRGTTTTALGILRRNGDSLLEPVMTLRRHFQTIENTLRRFLLLLAIPMGLSLLFGTGYAALLTAVVGLYAAIALGVDVNVPTLRWQTVLGIALTALLARTFLLTQPESFALLGGRLIAGVTGIACCVRLCGAGFTFRGDGWKRVLPVVLIGGAYLLTVMIFSLRHGIGMLVPAMFSLLLAAVIGVLLALGHRLFR